MRLLRWLVRVLKGIRDRIWWLLGGLLGPPAAALRRVVLAVRDLVDRALHRLLTWWANIWQPVPKDQKESLGNPSLACPLLAAFVLAATMYTWTSWTVLGSRWFYLLSVVVWIAALLVCRTLSFPDREGRLSDLIREAGQRPGLIWWERLGAAAGVFLLYLARATPHLLPLGIAVVIGFIRLLVNRYTLRELRRLREPPLQPPPPSEDDPSDEYVQRSFVWTLRAGPLVDDHAIQVPVHLPTYERMRRDNPRTLWNGEQPRFDRWIVEGATSEVDRAAYALLQLSKERRYSTYAEISNALAFVQAIPYALDIDSTGVEDYWRYPIETMHDQTGDCEDTTILAAAVLRRLGHRVGTMLLPDHAALAVEAPPGTPGDFIVHEGRPMYYCETTDTGWRVGDIPGGLKGLIPELLMVPD
jgi:hypothetical protein